MKFVLVISGVLALAALGWLVLPRLNELVPRRLEGKSTAFRVTGRYYYVNIDYVENVTVRGTTVTIHGFRLKNFGLGPKFETYPVDVVKRIPDTVGGEPSHRRWALVKAEYTPHARVFTLMDKASADTFSLQLPRGNQDLRFEVRTDRSGRDLVVFASGDWKMGPPSYYGYVRVERSR